ncbi:protein kinase [Diplodia corticola]|uniref:Protein kinase n=1 Tax=Diplodia corticola TaxID=236234 RepID=A0A1J9RI60_9PEZI|nr:protein kinase [Diplodia corticola]OJD32243.1 protein kinase [Diplodia corticola]
MTRYEYHGLVGKGTGDDGENHEYDNDDEDDEDDEGSLLEEDDVPGFQKRYYPIMLGQVIQDRYQVVRKTYWDECGTVWFCRDQKTNGYITLKVSTATSTEFNNHSVNRELRNYRYLQSINSTHPGRSFILPLLDTFDIPRSDGKFHRCLVHPSTVSWVQGYTDIKSEVYSALQALDFLHSANMTHCGGYVEQGVQDERVLDAIDYHKANPPSEIKGHPVYICDSVVVESASYKFPTLSRFSTSIIGPFDATEAAHPVCWRAPESLLQTRDCSHATDIWGLGCYVCSRLPTWGGLFSPYDSEEGDHSVYLHLAQMISLLGPPPRELVAKSPLSSLLFNNGRQLIPPTELDMDAVESALYPGERYWTSSWAQRKVAGLAEVKMEAYPPHPLPVRSLEKLPCVLEQDEKDRDDFVDFLRRTLTWQPQQRDTAAELLQHPWLKEFRHMGVFRKIYCSLPTYEGV